MKTQSAKAKGRRLQQFVRDSILALFPEHLEPGDVRSTSMGASGEDLLLSPAARRLFPFAVECKNQEKLNVWEALAQAASHAGSLTPLLVFKRNQSLTYVALRWDDFESLVKRAAKGEG